MNSGLLAVAALCGAGALCACTAEPPRPAPAAHAAPEPAAAEVLYDWHALMPAPLGTLLKDMPLALTEVLQFEDAAQGPRGSAAAECYTSKAAGAASFLGQPPHDYLLCFAHDRLNRVEASVLLANAAAIFAAACTHWQHSGTPGGRAPDRCEGSDGGVAYEAHLEPPATVSISLAGIAP